MQMLNVSGSVQPVTVRSAVFCIVCNYVTFVIDAIGDHIVKANSSIGFVMALYVESNFSLCLPHLFEERTVEYWYSFGCFGCVIFCSIRSEEYTSRFDLVVYVLLLPLCCVLQ